MAEDRDLFKTMPEVSVGPPKDSTAQSRNFLLAPDLCLQRARLICGQYRRDEAQDPDIFAQALALVLGDYPAHIVDFACDPRTGIITEYKMGLPNVGQIRDFLETVNERYEKQVTYEDRVAKQLQERDEWLKKELADKQNRPTYDELKAKHGPNWGLGVKERRMRTEDLEQVAKANKTAFARECRHHGVDPATATASPSLMEILHKDTN